MDTTDSKPARPSKKWIIIGILLIMLVGGGALLAPRFQRIFFRSTTPAPLEQVTDDIAVVAQDLTIPWEIAFLPEGDLLVTERPGRLLRINRNRTIIEVADVKHIGEGGLLGLALHPDFSENHQLYLYLTAQSDQSIQNRVERYRLDNNRLTDRLVILNGIRGSSVHDGGRIAFGPDNLLYITTGDAGVEDRAQDRNVLEGKILRVRDDGSIPQDNPFGTAVYSYGHRNPQGLAWDSQEQLWATEHGRSGVRSGFDEVNRIEKGKNYGWPVIEGDATQTDMETPIIHSGASTTWAPAGAAIVNNRLFFTGLRGESLYEAEITSDGRLVNLKTHFANQLGRLRAIRVGPDGFLYITTSNQDGRGSPRQGDDKVLRINIEALR